MTDNYFDSNKKERTRAARRKVDARKAIRKKRIDREVHSMGEDHPWYDNLHQYSKNKIHCSCPICAMKTRNNGKKGSCWGKSFDPCIPDKKQIDDMENQITELENDNESTEDSE